MEKQQQFNDGLVYIHSVGNTAKDGDMPIKGLAFKLRLCFSEQKVGITRKYLSLQNNSEIVKLIRVQRIESINEHDIAIINKNQYEIEQIQTVPDVEPKCFDLSLKRSEIAYDIAWY